MCIGLIGDILFPFEIPKLNQFCIGSLPKWKRNLKNVRVEIFTLILGISN